MTLLRLPVRQNTDEWLAMRRSGVTASEMPMVMGNKPGLVRLWSEKVGLLEPEAPDERTQRMYDIGHDLEDDIAAAYTRQEGRPLKAVEHMLRHHDVDWAYASLDRVSAVKGERLVVELKSNLEREWDGPEPVPAAVQDQVQWQLFVTGWPMAHVAVLQRSRVEVHEVPADAGYQDDLLASARWFHGLCERREMPPPDGSESTTRTLNRLHRGIEDVVAPTTSELVDLMHRLYAAKAEAKAASEAEAALENAIRALMGEATAAQGDGWRLTYRRNKDGSRTDWKAVAKALRGIIESTGIETAEELDAIEGLHTAVTEGPRVLRPTFKEEATSWL